MSPKRGGDDTSAPPPPDGGTAEDLLPEQLERLRRELADAPPEVVVANHGYGLFELAALHLSLDPPRLDAARLSVDALAGLLTATEGRLGHDEVQLKDHLAQLRLTLTRLEAPIPRGFGP